MAKTKYGVRVDGRGLARDLVTLSLPDEETDLAYLAGIFDGEGCISMLLDDPRPFVRNRIVIQIANQHEELMEWLASIGGAVYQRKDCMTWQLQRRADVIALLEALLPYLRVKRERALDALQRAYSLTREV